MASSSFRIVTPASDLTLLTASERRSAVGLAPTDNSKDLDLAALDARVAAMVATECNVARADEGAYPRTIKKERIMQSVSAEGREKSILLCRRHNIQIMTIDGSALNAAEMSVKSSAGILSYRRGGFFSGDFDIDYWAGFETTPDELKQVAIDTMRIFLD